jgi:hypothetical protein
MRTFRTKGLPGRWPPGSFSKDSVREILQRRFYTGVVVYYGVDEEGRKRKRDDYAACFPGQHPALITDEDFEAALDLRQQLSRRSRKPSGEPQIYLLSGLLVCSQCGERMRASSSGDRRYYRDLTRINHSGTCTQPTLKAEEIEQQVLDFMLGLHLPDDWRTWAREQVLSPQQQTEITMKQAELEARWKRVRELYLEGLLTKEEFQEERWQYQAAMTGLTPIDLNAIMEAGTTLEELPTRLGSTDSTLKQNRLLRLALVEAWVKEHSLIAVQARMRLLPSDAILSLRERRASINTITVNYQSIVNSQNYQSNVNSLGNIYYQSIVYTLGYPYR